MVKKISFKLAAGILLILCLGLVLRQPAQADSAAVSGQVFLDSNGNGIPESGESPTDGAELTLIKITGTSESIVSQSRTGPDGSFHFTGLEQGQYYLQSTLPSGLYYASPQESDVFMLPGQGRNSRSVPFQLAQGESQQRHVSVSKQSAYISIVAFGDLNMNSGRMSNEPLLRGVGVELVFEHAGQTYVIAQGSTDKDGSLFLRELTPASYRIRATLPDPYIIGPLGSKTNIFYNVIQPGENNIGVSEPFVLERSIGLGIGGVKSGSLSGRIWLDSDMNGRIDSGEGGQEGILLTLTHLGMGVSRTLTTTQDEAFTFTHLQAGEYSIKAALPEGFMFALPSSPSVFTAGYSDNEAVNIQVSEGQATVLEPIGVMPASGIKLVAFHDSNVDGLADEGEPAFANALVEVLEGDRVLASALTDSQGLADIPRVRSGSRTIRVSLADSQIFTVGNSLGNAFHSPSAASVLSIQRDIRNGEQLTLYAGATLKASAGGLLFEDVNLNSVMDEEETGLGGFTVQAINKEGVIAAQTSTRADGTFLFESLVPAAYQIRFLLVSPYVFSQPSGSSQGRVNQVTAQTPAFGETEAVLLAPGAAQDGLDAGAFRSAVINGSVLLGDEETGFEGLQGGLEGVLVELTDEEGQVVSEYTNAVTDSSGAFSLKGALPGRYRLGFTLPDDAKFSRPFTDETLVLSESFAVQSSDVLSIAPLYAVKTGIVSGTVFYDSDLNGWFDGAESALAGTALKLRNLKTKEVYESASGTDGFYELGGIRPGSYEISVALPEGYVLDANQASPVPASLSGAASRELTIPMGGRILDGLLPALKPIGIFGTAYYDNDLNLQFDAKVDQPSALQSKLTHLRSGFLADLNAGPDGSLSAQPMFPGDYLLEVTLPEDHLLTKPQNAVLSSGIWTARIHFDESDSALDLALVQLGSLSGAVWNMDGSLRDAEGLEISLLDETGKTLQKTSSDSEGRFRFGRLLPIPYLIKAQLPEQYRFARQVDTASRPSVILSDSVGAESSTGQSGPIKLEMGEHKAGQDIGMGAMGRLGDYAWLDLDKDGMQDAGEPGIPGIVISLYQYGSLSEEATTDAYGRYLFTSLFPGSYILQVTMPPELQPTIRQSGFPLVASILAPSDSQTVQVDGVIVPSGGRNLNADLGFVLRKEGQYPESLLSLPQKDWTRVNEQNPRR